MRRALRLYDYISDLMNTTEIAIGPTNFTRKDHAPASGNEISPLFVASSTALSVPQTQPTKIQSSKPPSGSITLDVAKSNRSKKFLPKRIVLSDQIPNDKAEGIPIRKVMNPNKQ